MSITIKNMLIGIFILGAIAVMISVIMFLKPTIGDGKETLYVRFSDINNINIGTRVLFAGRPIGEVVAMKELRDAREQPTDELGRVYFFQLTLHIDSHYKVYNTDEVSIKSAGLLGEKAILITPKATPKGMIATRITNQPIYADSIDTFQNALLDFSELSAEMEQTFRQVKDWIQENGQDVAHTFKTTSGAMSEIDTAVASVNQSSMIYDLQKSAQEFRGALAQVQVAMAEMEDKHTFNNLGTVIQNLKSATQNIDLLTEDMAQGKGTLGKLIEDNGLYLETNAVLSKANNLMNDINHYGILFHLNKQWQRTRLQRIDQLNALSTPHNFREYFQTEVDDINSSMTRINMLIEKAENSPEREKIFQNSQFRSDFAELLRKADELSDSLRLYNQQLSDSIGN